MTLSNETVMEIAFDPEGGDINIKKTEVFFLDGLEMGRSKPWRTSIMVGNEDRLRELLGDTAAQKIIDNVWTLPKAVALKEKRELQQEEI